MQLTCENFVHFYKIENVTHSNTQLAIHTAKGAKQILSGINIVQRLGNGIEQRIAGKLSSSENKLLSAKRRRTTTATTIARRKETIAKKTLLVISACFFPCFSLPGI